MKSLLLSLRYARNELFNTFFIMKDSLVHVSILQPVTFMLILSFYLSGCGALFMNKGPVGKPIAIEAVSSHEESLLQIQSSPTRFFVEVEGNAAAWERARFFLAQYTGPGRVEIQSSADHEQLAKVSASGYRYQISRTFEKGGAQYQVLCTPKKVGALANTALMNAKNLARFIREGELELGQIK